MIDSTFDRKMDTHTGRRKNRNRADRNLSILHAEIEATHHEALRRMANAEGLCVGEAIDKLIAREVRRRAKIELLYKTQIVA